MANTINLRSSRLLFFLVMIGGFFFAIFPEIGVSIFVVAFVIFLLENKLDNSLTVSNHSLLSPVAAFIIIEVFTSFFSLSFFQSFLQGVFTIVLVFLGKWLARFNSNGLFKAMLFGIIFSFLLVFLPKMSFKFFGGDLHWIDQPHLALQRQVGDVSEFRINKRDASWVLQNIIVTGPGRARYQLEIRSDTPLDIDIFVIHDQIENGRSQETCSVTGAWRKCSIEINSLARSPTTLGVGYGTWNLDNPTFQTRNSKIVLVDSPNFIDLLSSIDMIELIKDSNRQSGFSFNENAFGSQLTVVALLVLALGFGHFISSSVIFFATFSILLSGSRSALVAFLIGLMVFVFFKLFSRKLFIVLLPLFLLLAGYFISQTRGMNDWHISASTLLQQSGVRSLYFTDEDSARTRLEIWRLAIKAWLENPRTFLIGTGDLTKAMKAKFDARSSSFGLTKDSLTHAHNLWLQTAGESGLLGLCAMLWLWGWVILRAWRSKDAGALALLAAIFVINSVDYLFLYAPVHLAFWMAAAGLKRLEPTPVPPEGSAILAP